MAGISGSYRNSGAHRPRNPGPSARTVFRAFSWRTPGLGLAVPVPLALLLIKRAGPSTRRIGLMEGVEEKRRPAVPAA